MEDEPSSIFATRYPSCETPLITMPGKRTTSFFPLAAPLVVFFMLTVALAPLVPNHAVGEGGGEGYPYESPGDWIIDSLTYVHNETVEVNGNIIIQSGGKLILKGAVIKMNVSSDGEYYIEVQDGGELHVLDWDDDPTTMDDRTILTDGDHDNDSAAYNGAENHRYSIRVRDGSVFVMRNSELRESGFGGGDNAGVSLDGRADFMFEGNYVTKCRRGLMPFYTYNKAIRNNTFEACEEAAILPYYCQNMTIEDNVFRNNPHEGVYFWSHWNLPQTPTCNNTIRNNLFEGNQYGLYLYGRQTYNNLAYGNVHDNDKYGITTTTDPHNNTFRDNIIKNTRSYGVYTTTRTVNDTYENNTFLDNNYCILTTGRASGNLYINNTFRDTTNYVLYPTGYTHDNYYVNCDMDTQKYGIVATGSSYNIRLVNSSFQSTTNNEVHLGDRANLTVQGTPFSKMYIGEGSYLTEINYLDLHVEDLRGTPIQGADVEIISREIGIDTTEMDNLASPRHGTWLSSDSEYNWRFVASRAADGLLEDGSHQDNYWLTKNNPPAGSYLMLDFSVEKSFDLVRLMNCRNAGYQERSTKDFRLAISNNGTWFEDIHSGTLTRNDITNWYEVSLSEPVKARYLRFYVDSFYDNGAGLSEVEVFDTSNTQQTFQLTNYATEAFGGMQSKTDSRGNITAVPVITSRWYNKFSEEFPFEIDVQVTYNGWEDENAGLRLSSASQQEFMKDTLTVGASGKDFTTIQAAVNYASAGPERKVKVFPGNYSENVVVSDKELSLFTATNANNDTFIQAGGGTGLAVSGSENFAAEGFVIEGSNVGVDSGGRNRTYTSLSFEGIATPFLVRDHGELETIDSSYESSDIVFENGTGNVYERNNLVVEVRGRYGEPVAGATVQMWDRNGLQAAETTSSGEGTTSRQTLLHRVLQQGSETFHSPYEVNVGKGDGNFSETVEMNVPRHLIMTWYDPIGFGEALAVGDFDGDGFEDYAVGAPGYDGTGSTQVPCSSTKGVTISSSRTSPSRTTTSFFSGSGRTTGSGALFPSMVTSTATVSMNSSSEHPTPTTASPMVSLQSTTTPRVRTSLRSSSSSSGKQPSTTTGPAVTPTPT